MGKESLSRNGWLQNSYTTRSVSPWNGWIDESQSAVWQHVCGRQTLAPTGRSLSKFCGKGMEKAACIAWIWRRFQYSSHYSLPLWANGSYLFSLRPRAFQPQRTTGDVWKLARFHLFHRRYKRRCSPFAALIAREMQPFWLALEVESSANLLASHHLIKQGVYPYPG